MQEEVNEKTVALAKNTAKMTGRVLADLMRRYLASKRQKKQVTEKVMQKGAPKVKRGKTTLRQLQAQGDSLSTIEVTDQNIKSFKNKTKKYGITFSLKKDPTQTPPKYIVFFRGKDADVLTQAFKEYTALELAKANPEKKKPSIRQRLEQSRQKTKEAPAQQKERTKAKEAEQAR